MAAATRSPAASSPHVQRPPQPAGREGEAHAQRRERRGRPARRSRLEPAALPPPPPQPPPPSRGRAGQGAGGAEAAAPVGAGVGEGGHKEARAGRVWSRDKGGGERQLLGFKPWCLSSREERGCALCCSAYARSSAEELDKGEKLASEGKGGLEAKCFLLPAPPLCLLSLCQLLVPGCFSVFPSPAWKSCSPFSASFCLLPVPFPLFRCCSALFCLFPHCLLMNAVAAMT